MQSIQSKESPHQSKHILELFHEFQDQDTEHRYISSSSVRQIAQKLDISIAQVYGVLSFYHMFSYKPRARYLIRLCDSLSCRVMGSLDIYSYLRNQLGLQQQSISDDALFSLEIVNCLGSCHTAPNMMVNDQLVPSLSLQKLEDTIYSLKKEAENEQ